MLLPCNRYAFATQWVSEMIERATLLSCDKLLSVLDIDFALLHHTYHLTGEIIYRSVYLFPVDIVVDVFYTRNLLVVRLSQGSVYSPVVRLLVQATVEKKWLCLLSYP